MPCPRCAGTGTCPDCQGQGTQECPACSGAGTRQTSRGQSYSCKSCQGQGTVPCPTRCSSCEGTGEITEELQQKARDRYTLRFSNFTPHSQVTRILLALNVLVFAIGWNAPLLEDFLSLKADVFLDHHYWELLTTTFVHASLLHIAANMSFLWSYGPVLEGILGRAAFLGLYLAAGLVASALSWFGNCHLGGSYYGGVGASGSLFGLDGALLALYWRWRMVPWEPVRSLTSWAAIILLGGIAMQMQGFGWLDNWAHGGGFVAGFIIAAALPRPRGH